MLDSTRAEIMPRIRPAPVDEPNVAADHLLQKSDLMRSLQALLDAALAHAGAFNSDDDLPDYSALAEEAGLTLPEYEAVAMSIEGWDLKKIAKFQGVSVDASRSAYRRGLQKVRIYVLNSASATFSASVLRGIEGGDET